MPTTPAEWMDWVSLPDRDVHMSSEPQQAFTISPSLTPSPPLHCRYFEAGTCRSCSLLATPYAAQLAAKAERCATLLPQVPTSAWLPPFTAGDRGFRNRVKLVVGGASGAVTLGILGPDGHGVDLRECAIQAPEIAQVIPAIASFLDATRLAPYNVPERRGELKFAHLTIAPSNDLMVRFVVRSERARAVIRGRLGELRQQVPNATVISVNLLPEHKAVLEGEDEELLWGSTLAMQLGGDDHLLTLHLQPQSFFQTNTEVARALYAQAASWAVSLQPESVWDLYCGVGGFALHCAEAMRREASKAGSDPRVTGVELSEAAIASASRSAREAGVQAHFLARDATEFALAAAAETLPDLLIVNPPRRGIGETLAQWIEGSGVPTVIYSSCNPVSLAKDLAAMPSYVVREARLFDMFPHTAHLEVAVLLTRHG